MKKLVKEIVPRQETGDIKKFTIRLFIFIFVPLVWSINSVHSILVEPLDKGQFRSWEALSVLEKNEILKGPFYPHKTFQMVERGDLAQRGKFSVPKNVIWETDGFGYRKKDSGRESYDVVILGDSQTAGSTLTQSDMLTEKLEKRLKLSIYPYAPSNMIQYANDTRFQKNPPKVLVLASAERLFMNLPEVPVPKKVPFYDSYLEPLRVNKNMVALAVVLDRVKKKYFMEHFRFVVWNLPRNIGLMLSSVFGNKPQIQVPKTDLGDLNVALDGSMVFSVQPEDTYVDYSEKDFYWQIEKMLSYKKYLQSLGSRFIIMPIPAKENVYYNLVRGGKRPTLIPRFVEKARVAGLEVVDLQTSFEKFREQNPNELLYNIDDNHWNAKAVEVATQVLAEEIRQGGSSLTP